MEGTLMRRLVVSCLVTISAFAQSATVTKLAQSATVTIDASRLENPISPRLYAAFAEIMAEDINRGLTAEMIRDRSFEEAPNYLGLPAGWQIEPDTRNDNGGSIKFAQSMDEAYPKVNRATGAADHSLRVTLPRGDITDVRRGFSQGRLSIRAGESYKGYVWVKIPQDKGYSGDLTVALEKDDTDGETYSRSSFQLLPKQEWMQYPFTLTATQTDRFAKLSLLFSGRGSLYLDQVSLEPAAAQREVRPDSEEMVAKLRPSFIRWPGGNVAQDYHWQWGIGPRDLRPIWTNVAWNNAPEPSDFGTDEYLAFCRRIHSEPSITVNVNGAGATPEEAAAWVEYVNGPATSKYGALRAANGHPAPYGVKQWELGNEIFGDWVRGHTDAETYAKSAVEYAKAMRAVDPSIKLTAVGEGLGKEQNAWNSAVLRMAGPYIDFLAVHDYASASEVKDKANPRAEMMARPAAYQAEYRHTADLIAKLAPGRQIKQIVNEWNLFFGAQTIESMEGAVYASRMMNGFERDGDVLEATAISDMLNGWVGGVIQATRDRIYGTGQYYAIEMYNGRFGTERVHSEVQSPALAPGIDAIDAIATRSQDRSRLFVKLSNAQLRPENVNFVVKGFAHRDVVEATVLAAAEPGARNTFSHPHAIQPAESKLQCGDSCTINLPADSVAVLTFTAR